MESRAKKITFIVVLLIGALVLSFGYFYQNQDLPQQAKAQMSGKALKGWAWSSNIGCVSFNCEDQGVCGTSNYSVELSPSNKLNGYAWSSNIGWIAFDYPGMQADLNSDPNLEPPKQPAELVGDQIIGYAKALGGDDEPNDGWDGWIKMSGSWADDSGTPQGVRLNGDKLEGFAWGSDVVGWLNFDPQNWPGGFGGVTIDNMISCSSFYANPSSVKPSQTTTLFWQCSLADNCRIDADVAGQTLGEVCNPSIGCDSGSVNTNPITKKTTFTLTCNQGSFSTSPPDVIVNIDFQPTRCEVNPRTGVLECP
jgi:hypothetical protein